MKKETRFHFSVITTVLLFEGTLTLQKQPFLVFLKYFVRILWIFCKNNDIEGNAI